MNKWWLALLVALPFVAGSQDAVTTSQSWNFRVYLDDKPIGYHRFELQQQGERRELHSSARFDVKVLFINAYKYVHDADESWRGNCLQGMTASTDDNGKQLSMSATLQDNELNIVNRQRRYTVANCVMSFAYWNPGMLQQTRLLNAQTGEYDVVSIKLIGDATVTAHGVVQPARQYRLTGNKMNIDLWYSPTGEWLALESTTDGGRRLRYVLT